jgi:oxygen-independent coproporphyrinogen-3 oxidase
MNRSSLKDGERKGVKGKQFYPSILSSFHLVTSFSVLFSITDAQTTIDLYLYTFKLPGIYIHIPFCKQACHYCNFHFSTSLKYKSEMVAALLHELELRHNYLSERTLDTIYFGGGTPSLLKREELTKIFDKINEFFTVHEKVEITLEANPDDLTQDKLKELRDTPINRLSIGIQSFSEEDLRFMNRCHNAIEARTCIEYAQDIGFENLTIDLIYGAPTTSDAQWEQNLQITFDYEIPHVSAYGLTVEERTALYHFIQKGKVPPLDEEQFARQFKMLIRAMRAEGYEHYEISNFAQPGWYARHNTNYWNGIPYLGIGPSAHSFDGKSRQWNIANNAKYIKLLSAERTPGAFSTDHNELFEREALTPGQSYNEYVMTSLRTKWGCKLKQIQHEFRPHFLEHIQPYLQAGMVTRRGETFFLTDPGKLIADHIAMELFL